MRRSQISPFSEIQSAEPVPIGGDPCPASHPHCPYPLLALAAFAASPAHAQQPATTLTANGIGEAKPEPENRRSDASIRKAVAAANAKALPEAMANARAHAAELAAAAGVTLGPLVSISDSPNNGYGFFVQNGTFGNGHYCGRCATPDGRPQWRPPPRGVEGHAPGLPDSRGGLRDRALTFSVTS